MGSGLRPGTGRSEPCRAGRPARARVPPAHSRRKRMVAMERRAVPRLIRQSTITPKLLTTPQTYVVSALAVAPGRGSGAADARCSAPHSPTPPAPDVADPQAASGPAAPDGLCPPTAPQRHSHARCAGGVLGAVEMARDAGSGVILRGRCD